MRGKRDFVLPLVNNFQATTSLNAEIGSFQAFHGYILD